MKTTFTPGPWVAHHYGIRDRGGYICALNWPQHYDGQEARFQEETAKREGDARLIAAAPDLLAALEELLEAESSLMPEFVCGKDAQDAWANRRATARDTARELLAAIAKATQS